MQKSGVILLLLFVLFIFFLNWYFIFRSPCQPITKCYLTSVNISCASDPDCFLGHIRGSCNTNTFKCTNLVLEGDKQDCTKAGGEWIEWGCS